MKDSKPDFQVGDSVDVFIKAADPGSGRIGLSMWDPRSRPGRDRNGSGRGRANGSWDGSRNRGGRVPLPEVADARPFGHSDPTRTGRPSRAAPS